MLIRVASILFVIQRAVDELHRQLPFLPTPEATPSPSPPSPEATDFFMIGPFDDLNEEPQAASPPGSPPPPPPPLRNIDTNETERMGDMAGRNALFRELLVIPQMITVLDHYVEIALDFWNPEQHLRRIHRLPALSARAGTFQRVGHTQAIPNSYLWRTPVVRLQGRPDRVFSVVMCEIINRDDILHYSLHLMIVNLHAQIDMPINIVEQQVVLPLGNLTYTGPPMRYMVVVAYEQRTVLNVDGLRRQYLFGRRTFNPMDFAINLHLRPAGALIFRVDQEEIMGIWAGRHYTIERPLYN